MNESKAPCCTFKAIFEDDADFSAKFDDFVEFFGGSDATATEDDILIGKTAYVSGKKITGKIPSVGTQNVTLSERTQTIAISPGFHNGDGIVQISPTEQHKIVPSNIRAGVQILGVSGNHNVVDTSDATATEKDIMSGMTAYVDGEKIIGTFEMSYAPISSKEVNFRDYDGTILHSYTVAEVAELAELPPLPLQAGLICQGWNWSLADIKAHGRAVDVGATYITDDGKTRIYIHLEDGRTSPMLGCCPNGTVMVDWGDGTAPDILTGTSTSTNKFTPTHNYAAAGDYVVTLDVDGEVELSGLLPTTNANSFLAYILRHTNSGSTINTIYQKSIEKIEIGNGVSIGAVAFCNCGSLESITIPEGIISIGNNSFEYCYSLTNIVIPNGVTSIGKSAFHNATSVSNIILPNTVTSIGAESFYNCASLKNVTFPDSILSISESVLRACYSLNYFKIPDSVTSIGANAFYNCYNLSSINIPDGVTSIGASAFQYCQSIASFIVPANVKTIGNSAFRYCYGTRYYDFTKHTFVPTLGTNMFTSIAFDCEIRVPDTLVDEWKAENRWSTYADYIVGV